MFKKSLVAVAVLGAVAFSAQAADVQLYGRIDTGVRYTNLKAEKYTLTHFPAFKG